MSVGPWPNRIFADARISRILRITCSTILLVGLAWAKEAPINAIVLFDSPNGPAYAQVTGVLLNGKTELRVCNTGAKLDKKTYDTLLRIQLGSAASLERQADGVLVLATSNGTFCVVPSNLKFDKNAELWPAEAADQAVLLGTVVDPAQGVELPSLKPGVRIIFVPAADPELAQYLLAQRANTAKLWQDYLTRYPSSPHAGDAKKALAAIYESVAESAFAEYQKSIAAHAPDLSRLKQAQQQADQASKALEGYTPAHKLTEKISKELDSLLDADRAKLQNYRKAFTEHTAGYQDLAAAALNTNQILEASSKYAPALSLQTEIAGEQHKLDTAMDTGDAMVAAQRYEDAVNAISAYRSFAPEIPRLEAILKAAYTYHFNRGQGMADQQNWEQAAVEFRRALEIKPDNPDAGAALKNAQAQLVNIRNRQAADQALQQSKVYAAKNQVIEAYEVLANLPEGQRAFVKNDLAALQKDYVTAAAARAQKLQAVHLPIRGRADEDALREAYGLLQRASTLSGDPAAKLKLDLLSDKVGGYYFELAKRYLEKPAGSGIGLGWLYLMEAQRFNATLDGVKDEMAQYSAAYQLRSRFSIGVLFRDQTSRRDSNGFTDQITDAVANALDSSGLPVKVVRHPSDTPGTMQPNFLLAGEILQHRSVKNTNLETLPSKYRAGTHDVKNDAWVTANQQYQTAQAALTAAQRALADAQAMHKKKPEIATAADAVQAAQKQVDDAHKKLDSTEQTRPAPVIEPYNYTKKTIDLSAVVELAFRISDQASNIVQPTVPLKQENHKAAVVLENVKPEDTEGVKAQNTEPDENQFLTDLEVQARDILTKLVRDQAAQVPDKILGEARKRAQQGDTDGAAEEYILYLNATADTPSAERLEAGRFLREHFNVTPVSASNAS